MPALTQIPVLETERLRLRSCQLDDLPEFAAMWQDPSFYRFLGGQPLSEEETWRKMMGQHGHWYLKGYGFWSVEEKSTGRFIGHVGFADYNRDLTPSIKGKLEAGWVLAPRVHGLGYAAEAVQAALAWAEQHFPQEQIVCIIDPANEASLRVAHKFGFQKLALTMYKEQPIVILSRQ